MCNDMTCPATTSEGMTHGRQYRNVYNNNNNNNIRDVHENAKISNARLRLRDLLIVWAEEEWKKHFWFFTKYT